MMVIIIITIIDNNNFCCQNRYYYYINITKINKYNKNIINPIITVIKSHIIYSKFKSFSEIYFFNNSSSGFKLFSSNNIPLTETSTKELELLVLEYIPLII